MIVCVYGHRHRHLQSKVKQHAPSLLFPCPLEWGRGTYSSSYRSCHVWFFSFAPLSFPSMFPKPVVEKVSRKKEQKRKKSRQDKERCREGDLGGTKPKTEKRENARVLRKKCQGKCLCIRACMIFAFCFLLAPVAPDSNLQLQMENIVLSSTVLPMLPGATPCVVVGPCRIRQPLCFFLLFLLFFFLRCFQCPVSGRQAFVVSRPSPQT